jgi:hypothetical protein
MSRLSWTKNIPGTRIDIWRGDELAGTIRWENRFSTRAQAIINGKLFVMNREFILSKLEIYDSNGQSLLGTVFINLFNPRYDVVINGKRFELEIRNIWQSRWSWKFNGTEIITYSTSSVITKERGSIDMCTTCNDEVDILILLGLAVRNQFFSFLAVLILIILLIIL